MDLHAIRTLLASALLSFALLAQPAAAAPDAAIAPNATPEPSPGASPADEPIDEVIVSGEQPGPPLWKISKGDHVVWVLGTLTPLPKDITWHSHEVETVISHAKQIIAQEQVSANIGFFRGMRLLPAAMRARHNPDGAELKDVLSPEDYARWQRLKTRYLGSDRRVESFRPILAGYELYNKALEKSGLSRSNVIWPSIRKLAKKYDVPIDEPRLKIDVDDPRGLIRDFTEMPKEMDIACFRATMDRLETDLEPMKQRAGAWAVGDVETLQRLQSRTQEATCLDAVTSVPRLQEEYAKLRARARAEWLATVQVAIAKNDVTLAILPMTEILSPTGRLWQLPALGYKVEAP